MICFWMQLVQEKRYLIEKCNELVAAVKDQEHDLAAEVRAVYKDAETSIESEKKAFRAGYEDRLQKVSVQCPTSCPEVQLSEPETAHTVCSSCKARRRSTRKTPRGRCTRTLLACRCSTSRRWRTWSAG